MSRLSILLFFILFFSFVVKPSYALSALHVDGKYLKNETGDVVILHGVNAGGFGDYSSGWYSSNWNEANVRSNFAAMKSWGINAVRIMGTVRWWLENSKEDLSGNDVCSITHRDALTRTISIAQEYGIYVIFTFWSIDTTGSRSPGIQDYLPYPPTASTQNYNTIRSSNDFVEVWAGNSETSTFLSRFENVNSSGTPPTTSQHVHNNGVAPPSVSEALESYTNVIYELYNEPAGNDAGWADTTQRAVDAIRARGDEHPIMVQAGYCGSFYSWFDIMYNKLSGRTNIIYSNHIYRGSGSFPDNAYLYTDVNSSLMTKTQSQNGFGIGYVLNRNVPVVIGETGGSNNNPTEVACLNNTLKVLNENGVSWFGWEWRTGMGMSLISGGSFTPTQTGQIVKNYAPESQTGMNLHTEGKYIKDASGNVVYLRGVNRPSGFTVSATGNWFLNGDWIWGYTYYGGWSETGLRQRLQQIKDMGFNTVRLIFWEDWWQDDVKVYNDNGVEKPLSDQTYGYRYMMEQTVKIAQEYGIYIIYSPYGECCGQAEMPFPGSAVPNQQAFADMWKQIAQTINYPNVLFELFNEPAGDYDTWMNAAQAAITSIRSVSNNLIIAQYGYAGSFDFVTDSRIQGTNIVYSNHIYHNVYGSTLWNYYGEFHTYDQVKNCLLDNWNYDVALASNKPLYIGEFGHWYQGVNYEEEAFNSTLRLMNEWNMSYTAWEWDHPWMGWYLQSDASAAPYPANNYGQMLAEAITSGSSPAVAYQINLTGTVTDSSNGSPITSATITCNAYTGTTNSTGRYLISMTSTGSCTLAATGSGYNSKSISLNYPSNGTYTNNFALDKSTTTRTVTGSLKDNNNNALQASVVAYQGSNIINSNQTSTSGSYSLSLTQDVYDIQFNISNVLVKFISVNVSSDLSNLINYFSYNSTTTPTTIPMGLSI
jgi:aryl-phospho-beta-D-glucosidase BglC (GH1 family)